MNTNIKIGFDDYDEYRNHNYIKATITAEELEKLLIENKGQHIICLKGLIVEGDLDLRGIKFKGVAWFGNVTFEGGVGFGKAIFEGRVDFIEATFKSWVDFGKAKLRGKPLKEIYKLENKRLINIYG